MQYLLSPHSKRIEPFAWWDNAFTEEELNWLQQKAKNAIEPAQVSNVGNVDEEIRRSELNWLHNISENRWVFDKLANIVCSLNTQYFSFDLTGFGEAIQLANYGEDKQGMYIWHQDFGKEGISRKLSVVMQLSEPSQYEGGELQLLTSSKPISIQKKRGLITVFPAWSLHQVTPVVKGNRQSLVTWISGPQFR